MPPKRKIPPTADETSQLEPNKKPQPEKKTTFTLSEIIEQYGNLKSVEFVPFLPEEKRAAKPLLPTNFPIEPTPANFFDLFFTDDIYKLISENTNKFTLNHRENTEKRQREWVDLIPYELRVFVGAIIYMGVHEEPQIESYWNTNSKKGPVHTIPSHMTLRRFEQIKRFLHISCPEEDARRDAQKDFTQPSNSKWWYKLEPLSSRLQASFQRYYSPSSNVSIDELMVGC